MSRKRVLFFLHNQECNNLEREKDAQHLDNDTVRLHVCITVCDSRNFSSNRYSRSLLLSSLLQYILYCIGISQLLLSNIFRLPFELRCKSSNKLHSGFLLVSLDPHLHFILVLLKLQPNSIFIAAAQRARQRSSLTHFPANRSFIESTEQ